MILQAEFKVLILYIYDVQEIRVLLTENGPFLNR